MNAYELAEKLEWHWDNDCRSPAISKSADMLRQQADRIAELEKALEHEGISVGRDLLNGGVALSKKLPQTKPLSDEEVFNLTAWKKNPYELYVEMEKEDMIAFARAIEERHGIK